MQTAIRSGVRQLPVALAAAALILFAPAAGAKRDDAPGLQHAPGIAKKVLTMSHVRFDFSGNMVTASWLTNKPADTTFSATEFPPQGTGDPLLMHDPSMTFLHRLTVNINPGTTYDYDLISVDADGQVVHLTGRFTAPNS